MRIPQVAKFLCVYMGFVAMGCAVPKHVSSANSAAPPDGRYTFVVDREWQRSASRDAIRQAALVDSDFLRCTPQERYRVTVREDGRSVQVTSIGSPTREFGGERQPSEDGSPRYTLTTGAFAGGHLSLMRQATGFSAELTLYGSGAPIVSSERGGLSASHR